MKAFDLGKMALGNLNRRKSRTLLTVLGIVIGTISIVLMIALGLGMQESVNEQFANLSSVNVIEVSKGDSSTSDSRSSEQTSNGKLQDIDLEFLGSIEGVALVAPIITSNAKLVSGKYEANVQLLGIDFDYLETLGYNLESTNPNGEASGILFGVTALEAFDIVDDSSGSSKSNDGGSMEQMFEAAMKGGQAGGMPQASDTDEEESVYNVDVYSDRISFTLDTSYSPQSGQGDTAADVIRLSGYGILEEGDMTRDRYAYMDIELLTSMMEDYNNAMDQDTDEGYDSAYVYVEDIDDSEGVQEYIDYYGYTASSSADFIETMQGTIDTLTIALGAIGAVALLVAAIGITNTMIMAIHERKKEIGVMKVIGATLKDIKRLFLIEAALIGLLGGVIGIGISVGLSWILSSPMFSSVSSGGGMRGAGGMTSMFKVVIPSWLIGMGMVFTTVVGVISGYIPARQAMSSSALEAIRNE